MSFALKRGKSPAGSSDEVLKLLAQILGPEKLKLLEQQGAEGEEAKQLIFGQALRKLCKRERFRCVTWLNLYKHNSEKANLLLQICRKRLTAWRTLLTRNEL